MVLHLFVIYKLARSLSNRFLMTFKRLANMIAYVDDENDEDDDDARG